MPAVIPIAAAVIGGAIAADGSRSAANKQASAANAATAQQGAMFDKTTALNAPYNQAGQAATSRLSELLGINSKTQDNFDANAYLAANPDVAKDPYFSTHPFEHYQQYGQSENRAFTPMAGTGAASADFGSLNKPFSMSDFQLDPGIQFQTQQGNLALQNSQAAKDGVLSGGAMKALIGYNQGMAGLGYQSAFDRYMAGKKFTLGSLMDVSKTGQAAASGVTSAAPSFSSGIAGTITGAGNAQAAGTVGSANAISSGIQGAGNGIFLNSLLNNQNGGGNGVTVPGTPTPGAAMQAQPDIA